MSGSHTRRLDAVPSFPGIADDPGTVGALSDAEVGALMMRALAVKVVLQARVLRGTALDAASQRGWEPMLNPAVVARG